MNKPLIISISGGIGSGKDTIADYLVSQHGYRRESFAASLKDAVSVIFKWDRAMLEGRTAEARKERDTIDKWWAERLQYPHLTPRWVLQNFGTDCCRNNFHNDIWLASLENKLRDITTPVVISDTRFMNELKMIARLGGLMITVRRGEKPDWWETAKNSNKSPLAYEKMLDLNIHPSEWEWVPFPFDEKIYNNQSISDLHYRVNDILTNNQA